MTHFEDAVAFCRNAGYRPELAWSCHDYADTLVQRNSIGDRAKALSLLDEALAISQELRMRPLMERVVAVKEKAESQPASAPAYPDGLTQREVEVLQLIAAGKTDREIADELFISARTVGYHVGNILNKTTSSNRTEAATYAGQHGLV
jgi:DNA-binding NarL/FixJ family response regulator